MAKEQRQRVRFTGKRTGLAAISIKGVGVVEKGDTIEVSEDEAEAWTTDLPMRDGKEGSDWTKVGSVYKLDEGEVAQKRMMQREKFAPEADEALPDEVNTELAHPVEDTGTVEEEAEVITAEPEPEKKDSKK